ncbi:unnamed protein product [Auanema sp. JU1783]|nr:unnamed protein product [Auanema sp. JU1783]
MPYVAVVADNHIATTCHVCFTSKEDRTLSRCSRCRFAHYCSKECQKKDWLDHKYECMFLINCAPKIPCSMARMISRLVLKLGRDEEEYTAFNGRKFSDLMDNREFVKRDPGRSEFFVCVSHVLMDYMGVQFVPKPDIIMSYFGKIVTNCFTILDEDMNDLGQGLYIGLSVHDHSCDPDAFVLFDGAKALLRTPTRDKRYGKAIKVSYTDLFLTNTDRKQTLKSQYYFDCVCAICSDETRDHWMQSVRTNCCSGGFALLDPTKTSLHCYQCGTASPLAVDAAIKANQELDFLMTKKENKRSIDADLNERLRVHVENYERFSKILSPLNSRLAVYSLSITEAALKLNRQDLAIKYAFSHLDASRRYLPRGHPELAVRLQGAAICKSFEDPPTGLVLELFQEAYEAALTSHGPRHSLTSNLDHMVASYKIRLQLWESI